MSPEPPWDTPGAPVRIGRGPTLGRMIDLAAGHNGSPSAPPDNFAIPHVWTFSSVMGSAYRTYTHDRFDEARRHARQDSIVMRNDCHLMRLLQERKLAVASLKWHLEVENEQDAAQVMVRDDLQARLRNMKGLRKILMSLLEAIWYGRHGVQVRWRWAPAAVPAGRALTVAAWKPVNGDKIGHAFDGIPYVLVYSPAAKDLPGRTIVSTRGHGLLLEGDLRERFVIHSHEPDDMDFFDSEQAEAVFGVGVRSRLFWVDWIKREWLANVATFMQRVGLGVTIWYFEAGNPQSEAQAATAAREQSGRVNILWPRSAGGKGSGSGVERLEVPAAGAEFLMRAQQWLGELEELYVIGQTMSSGSDDESGMGGSGRANFAKDTKFQIRNFDAANLADTLTGDDLEPGLVSVMKAWTWPGTEGFPVRWVFDTEQTESKEKLEGAKVVFDMGVPLQADEVRGLAGLSKPGPGDEAVQQQAPAAPGEGVPGGLPGEDRPDKNRYGRRRYGFDPQEPRDEGGRWEEGGGSGSAKRDGGGGKPLHKKRPWPEPDPSGKEARAAARALDYPLTGASEGIPSEEDGYEPYQLEATRLAVDIAHANGASYEEASVAHNDDEMRTEVWQVDSGGGVRKLAIEPHGDGLYLFGSRGEKVVRFDDAGEIDPEAVSYWAHRLMGYRPPAHLSARFGKKSGGPDRNARYAKDRLGDDHDPADGRYTGQGGGKKVPGRRPRVGGKNFTGFDAEGNKWVAGKVVRKAGAAAEPIDLSDHAGLASAVKDAGKKLPDFHGNPYEPGKVHAHSVHVTELYEALLPRLGGASLADFKSALLNAHLSGALGLERHDLAQTNPGKATASEIEHRVGHKVATFHGVNVRYARARDVSGEPRDEGGKWAEGGGTAPAHKPPAGTGESHAFAMDLHEDLDDRGDAPPIFHEPHRVKVEGQVLALLGAAGKGKPSLTFRLKHDATVIHSGDRTLGTVVPYEDSRGLGVEVRGPVIHGRNPRAVIMPGTPPHVAEYRLRRVLRLPVSRALREAQPAGGPDRNARGHDVSGEPRDDEGRWEEGGGGGKSMTPRGPGSKADRAAARTERKRAKKRREAGKRFEKVRRGHARDAETARLEAAVESAHETGEARHAAALSDHDRNTTRLEKGVQRAEAAHARAGERAAGKLDSWTAEADLADFPKLQALQDRLQAAGSAAAAAAGVWHGEQRQAFKKALRQVSAVAVELRLWQAGGDLAERDALAEVGAEAAALRSLILRADRKLEPLRLAAERAGDSLDAHQAAEPDLSEHVAAARREAEEALKKHLGEEDG